MNAKKTETRITWDAEENLYLLFDRDGDVVDGYETIEEANEAKADHDAADSEADHDELVNDLQSDIQSLVDGCDDIDLLKRIKAMLEG